jgi:hypothetical protein
MEKRKQKERLQSLLSQDENDLTLILPSIYLSSHRTARHLPTLHRHCIDTIITIAPTTQAPFDLERNEENREHLRIDVDDDGTFYTAPLFTLHFQTITNFSNTLHYSFYPHSLCSWPLTKPKLIF